jgi:hypothetical protein
VGRKIPSETATGELLSEDKSEGKRIYTDYHEEQDGAKSRTKKRRGAHEAHEPKPGRTTPSHRKSAASGPGKRRINTKDNLSETKLSELPLEERMAYYRQKYGNNEKKQGKAACRKQDSAATRDKTQIREGKDRNRKSNKRESGQRRSASSDRKSASPSRHAQSAENSAVNQTAAQGNATSANETKKGFFTRLFGIFQKKETE